MSDTAPTPLFSAADEAVFLSSPALRIRKLGYPARFEGRVPRLVRTRQVIRSDIPSLAPPACVARPENVYLAWTNSYGAVAAVLSDGKLGLKPDEFDVIEWADLSKASLAAAPNG